MTTIALYAVKGGVGKTTTTVNLATAFVKECQKKVLIIDTNLQAPNVGLHVGVTQVDHGFEEVLEGKYRMMDAIYHHAFGFDLLIPNLATTAKIARLKEKIAVIKDSYDIILLDTMPAQIAAQTAVLDATDAILIVTTQDTPTMLLAQKTIKSLQQRGYNVPGVICNKAAKGMQKKEMEEMLGLPIIATIPESILITKSLADVQPLLQTQSSTRAACAYIGLAKNLVQQEYQSPTFWSQWYANLKESWQTYSLTKATQKLE